MPFVAAVAVNDEGHPIAMRMRKVNGFHKTEIKSFTSQHVAADSKVVSDGLPCFSGIANAGCIHQSTVTGGGPDIVDNEHFTWVNTMLGKVNNVLYSTYHAINAKHLPRYLAEFSYRFNRRFKLEAMLPRLGYVAVRTTPMPFGLLKMAEVD